MNELPPQPSVRRWTLAEFERMTELGILTEDDRVELIGGELVPMSPKGNRHERVCGAIHNWLRRHLPSDIDYHPEPGWRADTSHYFEPDFLVGPAGFDRTSIPPGEVLLLIEVAHSSLAFDTTTKADQYAALGVREYWVIDAVSLATRVHRGPSASGYADVRTIRVDEPLTALLVPSLAFTLAGLGVDP